MRRAQGGGLLVVFGALAFAISLLVVSAGVFVVGGMAESRGVSVRPLRALAERSTILDGDGNVIGRLGLRDREDVALSEVPKVLQDAVVAAEDATFWTNRGIDLLGLARAAWSNVQTGRVEQGGSTITQQLVKNRVLSSERTAQRKLRELALALAYAKRYSKREILEQYLNTVYFGQGAYGVRTAAERFFATEGPFGPVPGDLQHLTLGQAALLAGSISNPEGNNPFTAPERALARRRQVLDRMVAEGYTTAEEADRAAQEPLPAVVPLPDLRPRSAWAEEVQDRLLTDPRFAMLGDTQRERERRLLTGGLTIRATLDPRVQAAADAAVAEAAPADRPDFVAALVAIDPATGAVRAMTAGRDFSRSQYNLATSTPGRQAGSTWKVITLAAALAAGFSPQDPVDGSSPCTFPFGLGETRNFESGGGGMTLRAATVGSVNCAFARTQLAVGTQVVIDLAHRMGVRQQTLQPILTLTLGAIETTPLEMATVAATLANGGVRHWPNFVQQIVDRNGQVLYDAAQDAGERVLTADVVACESAILQEVVQRGTGSNARLAGRPAAGKTGTTDGRSDANFLGYTPGLAAFVWYGNPSARVEGAGFGGDVPARVFKAFMDAALAGTPVVGFPDPGPVCARPPGNRIPGFAAPAAHEDTEPAGDATAGPSLPPAPQSPATPRLPAAPKPPPTQPTPQPTVAPTTSPPTSPPATGEPSAKSSG